MATTTVQEGNGRLPRGLAKGPDGLTIARHFTIPGVDPMEAVEWVARDARLVGAAGETVFEQCAVEVPVGWSPQATNVVASKYFRGALGSAERESSVRQLFGRVVGSIVDWGIEDGYFASDDDAETFRHELSWLLLNQRASFNSPVWFNVGTEAHPQCSACFINSVDDTMESILELVRTEGMLFKYGSGSGSNLSSLRGSGEALSSGGTASGPVSFMRGLDAFAGAIKSGGTTRRAARMVMLDIDHPDIEMFIRCKEVEERKAQALVAQGYDAAFDAPDGAYASVAFQNANHSVRVSDEFMRAVESGGDWTTRAVVDGEPIETRPAGDLLDAVAAAAWVCGDPGLQFDSTINAWHTCPASGRIDASNPCSEFMFLDDTACNLASINLLSFDDADGFDAEGLVHAVEVIFTAQEILVDRASYPTTAVRDRSRRYRPLGLGYANLGGLLMANALPYDSDEGRAVAAAVTALLTGAAYRQSARLAATKGPFEAFAANRGSMLDVMERHRRALDDIEVSPRVETVRAAAVEAWTDVLSLGALHGLRNSQASVLAPTGTIAFMMDCDTTGVEPEIALVKHKRLVGGGVISTVNRLVPRALERLGYGPTEIGLVLESLEERGTVEGAPGLADEHLAVFDCAFRSGDGSRSIGWSGHLAMMGAVQPFISGAISKTVNVVHETTVGEIREVYLDAWRMGLKALAVYRDGCKGSQPLSTTLESSPSELDDSARRRRLPDERQALTHKFSIADHEGYITVGLYEDGQPGEIFLVMAKEGSTISGLMDAFATAISIALQYGVPLPALVEKFSHTRFEPCGFTRNREVPYAKSVTDYIFRWLASKFLDAEASRAAGVIMPEEAAAGNGASELIGLRDQQDAPPCRICGAIMVRSGSCYRCLECGDSSGCS